MMGDAINPDHYRGFSNGAEVIDISENLTSNGGQAVQYIARSCRLDGVTKGDPIEDLRKACWFLERELERKLIRAKARREEEERAARAESEGPFLEPGYKTVSERVGHLWDEPAPTFRRES